VPISSAMVATARRHRIHLVLAAAAHAAHQTGAAAESLFDELRRAVAVDLMRERTIRGLVEVLAATGVDVLLLKGAGLAYTVYAAPYLRPRADVDVMISRGHLERAEQALMAAGWTRPAEPEGELVTGQRHYVLHDGSAFAEHLDLHWRIANPRLFCDAVVFEELLDRAVRMGALGPSARTLSLPDSLFVACLHRVAHHADGIDLLWLWDIHLLASRLSAGERAHFVGLAQRESMRAVCVRGLELAFARFRTAGAVELIAALRASSGEEEERREPSARFLDGNLRQVDLLQTDLSRLGDWRARLRFVGQHLFPSASYMRAVYPRCPAGVLPLAYVHRIVRGAPRWFRRQASPISAAGRPADAVERDERILGRRDR
jgi:Uncharacterised nucleotidyltransferase